MAWPDCSGIAPTEDRFLTLRRHDPVRGKDSIALRTWAAFAAIIGVIDFWGTRYNLNPDGISYVEMARHAIAGGPGELINGYWSPGYPALLVPVTWLVRHEWATMIPALHAVNLAIYLLSLFVFLRLLHAVRPVDQDTSGASFAERAVPLAAIGFAVIAMQCIGIGFLTPDFGVMLVVLLTVGCCLQLERSANGWRAAILLGLVMGLGYWMKGILLPLNIVLLAGLFLLPPRVARARMKLLVAAGAFALSSIPLVVLVSNRTGHPTIGEVGKLNYAWEVDGVTPFVGWLGDSAGTFGQPIHPPRLLQVDPQTLEFATPVHATYPLWFDPAYWYAGVRPRIDLAGQWRVLRQGVHDLLALLHLEWAIGAGVLALWLASGREPGRASRSRMPLVIGLWSCAAALVYALVHVEPRYLAGFVAAGVVVAWSALARRAPRSAMRFVLPAALVLLLVSLAQAMRENTGGFEPAYRPDYLLEAEQLHRNGLVSGDRVAVVGDAFENYAAFGAETPIAAQVMDSAGFWNLAAAARLELQAKLAAIGIKAILANNVSPAMTAEGWRIFSRPDASNLGVRILGAP